MSAGVWTERSAEGHVVSFEARSVSTAADSLAPPSVSHRRPAPRNSSVQAVNTTLTTTQGGHRGVGGGALTTVSQPGVRGPKRYASTPKIWIKNYFDRGSSSEMY